MSCQTVTSYTLRCDGCEVMFGVGDEHATAMDLRAAAYGAGWRYPAKLDRKGQPSSGTNAGCTSDVCPGCFPEWTPVPARRELAEDEKQRDGRRRKASEAS